MDYKKLALDHCEKPVVGICLALMGMYMLEAVGLKSYQRKPEDFDAIKNKARQIVTTSPLDESQLVTPNFEELVKKLDSAVDVTPYYFASTWRRQFEFSRTFRNQPTVLTASKPQVQANSGSLALFRTDLKGLRATRKVKKSEAVFIAAKNQTNMVGDLLMSSLPDAGSPDGAAGMATASIDTSFEALTIATTMYEGQDFGRQLIGDGASAGMEAPAGPIVKAGIAAGGRQKRFTNLKPGENKEGDPKKTGTAASTSKKKEDEYIEEYIQEIKGKRWVEIVATFPHSEQIKKYVEALKDGYDRVGLRYALADVQRRELTVGNEWSPWANIPLKEQFRVVQNAVTFEPEDNADVVFRGLAMNIPFIQSAFNPFLMPEELKTTERATYPPEYKNPKLYAARAKAQAAAPKRPQKGFKKVTEEERLAAEKKRTQSTGVAGTKKKVDLSLADIDINTKDPKAKGKAVKKEVTFDNHYQIKNALVRFWDFTVVPGKRYQYRLRILTYNPNFQRSDVADPAYAINEYLSGDWTEPSDEVFIETDQAWYASKGAIAKPRRKDDKRVPGVDSAKVELHFWDRNIGEWVTSETVHRVGDIVGKSAQVKNNEIPKWNDVAQRWEPIDKNYANEFNTGSVLLAVDGGEKLERKIERMGDHLLKVDLPHELVSVNVFGDIERRNVEVDEQNQVRELVKASYKELVDTIKRFVAPPPAAPGANPAGNLDPAATTTP